MKLSIDKLKEVEESKYIDSSTKEIMNVLLAAIDDWPHQVFTLNEFDNKVIEFIGREVSKNNINIMLENIDLSKYAWQAESLSQLLFIYAYYKDGVTLTQIILELQSKVNKVILDNSNTDM